jgi:hypothetical protein
MPNLEELVPAFLLADFEYLILVSIFCSLLSMIFLVVGFYFVFLRRDDKLETEAAQFASQAEWEGRIREHFIEIKDADIEDKQKVLQLSDLLVNILENKQVNRAVEDAAYEIESRKGEILEDESHVPYPNEISELASDYKELVENTLFS